jgi:hypothetical protein
VFSKHVKICYFTKKNLNYIIILKFINYCDNLKKILLILIELKGFFNRRKNNFNRRKNKKKE